MTPDPPILLGGTHRATLGVNKGYDTRSGVDELHCADVTTHVVQDSSGRSSAIDGPTSRCPGYAASRRFRKRIEECLDWAKTVGGSRKSRFVGREKLDFHFVLTMGAYKASPDAHPGGGLKVPIRVSREPSACSPASSVNRATKVDSVPENGRLKSCIQMPSRFSQGTTHHASTPFGVKTN